jgi:hypothetical protein
MKARRTEHLRYLLGRLQKWDNHWPADKITHRRGYNITDIVLWCDYIDMFIRLGRGTYNATTFAPIAHKKPTTAQRKLLARKSKATENPEK